METNNMVKYAVRDMIKHHPDKLAERLSRILTPDECYKLFNGVIIDVGVKDFDAFIKRYNLPVGKTHIDNVKLDDDYVTVYCTILDTDENGEKLAMEKSIKEYCSYIAESYSDVYEVTYL